MLAGVIRAPQRAELRECPVPEPGPGQVRVRIAGCGVCGSDLPVWQGREWFDYPREPGAPGHEPWGVVDKVGGGVTGLCAGDPVAGVLFHAYAEYELADPGQLIRLPDELAGQPFPGEALGCAVNVFRRSGIQAGMTVAVVGTGFLGSVVIQLVAAAGAQVIALGRRAAALELARRMGAAETVALDAPGADPVQRVTELNGGELCDVVVEAAGVQATLDTATKLTRTRGRLVIAGFHQDGPRTVDMQLWNWRGLDVINAHERERQAYVDGIATAARQVAEGRLDPAPLYTHSFALADLGGALSALEQRPDGFMKALVLT